MAIVSFRSGGKSEGFSGSLARTVLPVLLLFLLPFSALFGQDDRSIRIICTVFDKSNGKILEGYIVEIYDGNSIVHSPQIEKKGKTESNLPAGINYTFEVSMVGYYPKRFIVMGEVPAEIKKIPTLEFEAELLRKSDYEVIEKADIFATSVFDMPYVIFEWDGEMEEFNYRKAYTDHIKAKYEEVSDLR